MNNIQALIEAWELRPLRPLTPALVEAMPEIIEQDRKYRELVEWFRREGAHGEFCGYYDNNPCTCGFDHVSELVGEGK